MLSTSKIIAFVPTMKPELANFFYGTTLELPLIEDDSFALIFNAHGILLRVTRVSQFSPASYTILGWEVKDIHATITFLNKKGINFEQYEELQQDEKGIWTAPDGAKIAWFKDPDGNTLSITE